MARLIHTAFAVSLGLWAVGCAGADAGDPGLTSGRQTFLDGVNGLSTINGLTSINGLRQVNGLTSINGLSTINGLTSINGLATLNGLPAPSGLSVDCQGLDPGIDCTGSPDGILSSSTGLMASDGGIMTARYLVRCALPSGDAIRVKDYTGAMVTLSGEIGLTPAWKEGQCTTECEEKISACLMALTNGNGEHITLELSAPYAPVGADTSGAFPFQEAAFYGNVFKDPPEAYYCVGDDYAVINRGVLQSASVRACKGYTSRHQECPYVQTGLCNALTAKVRGVSVADAMCFASGMTETDCRASSRDRYTWRYPLTTHRAER
jgi:hypothetical protein